MARTNCNDYSVLREGKVASKTPILSIAIPTFKRFDLLKETLNSVFALSFSVPVEILVVDNDPDNQEQAISAISQYSNDSFTYYKNTENLGMYGNWNQCLSLAKGKYITILHDDDLLLTEFAEQMNTLLQNGALPHDLIGFEISLLDQRENKPAVNARCRMSLTLLLRKLIPGKSFSVTEKGIESLFFSNIFAGTLGVVINRELALSIGGFNSRYYPIADYDFWCRWVAHYGNIYIFANKVGLYRLLQNDTLRMDVREGFITGSTMLRQALVDQHLVPWFFKHLIGITGLVQKKWVDISLSTKEDVAPSLLVMISLRFWQILAMGLIFLCKKRA
jgi:glycosyltransferase involved in cell wall biosynthesis